MTTVVSDIEAAPKRATELLIATVIRLESTIAQLNARLAELTEENRELKRLLFGSKSERQKLRSKPMPPVPQELSQDAQSKDPKTQRRNGGRKNKRVQPKLKEKHEHHQPSTCSRCASFNLTPTGVEDTSDEIEFVPAHFIRVIHHRHRKRCLDCQHIVHAPPPYRPSPSCDYGVQTHVHVAVSKCSDSMPVYRLAQSLQRQGLHISRSTLNEMFHRTADVFAPLHRRILEHVKAASHINADETPIRIQAPNKCKRGYVWTFIANDLVAFEFSPSRSGQVPKRILGDSPGMLQADAYSGYNTVCVPNNRNRAGCFAHVRRKFWIALEDGEDEAQKAIDMILDLYRVEYDAADKDIIATAAHGALRRHKSRPLLAKLFWLCRHLRGRAPPKSSLGKATFYALNNWKALSAIIRDPKLRLDNNIAEGALRIIALGRKNFLFVGNNDGGYSLAVLQTIVATCKANDVNPMDYMVEVMPKLACLTNKDSDKLDDLLPKSWANRSK